MTDTVISDAVAFPQDEGITTKTGSTKNQSSAAFTGTMGQHVGGPTVLGGMGLTYSSGTFDIGAGTAAVVLSNPTVQSTIGEQTDAPPYDTTLQSDVTVAVALPSSVTGLDAGTGTSPVWVAYDVDTADVYVRHGDGTSEPTDPSVRIGTVDNSSNSVTVESRGYTLSSSDASSPALTLDGDMDAGGNDLSGIGSLGVGELIGDIAGGDTITNLSGNIYVQPTEPTAQNEGDIWIDTS